MAKGYIYALVDPIEGLERYVGFTMKPALRIGQHISEANPRGGPQWGREGAKHEWIRKVIAKGHKPVLIILAEVPMSDQFFWENFYANLYPKEQLYNYRSNLQPNRVYVPKAKRTILGIS